MAKKKEKATTYKVAYNACFGGFSLSREAVLLARKLSGNPKWGGTTLKGEIFEDTGEVSENDYGSISREFDDDDYIARHDPILVQVIEELGDKANGCVARLRIAEIPIGTPYRIDEYDGNERVMTSSSYNWIIPE